MTDAILTSVPMPVLRKPASAAIERRVSATKLSRIRLSLASAPLSAVAPSAHAPALLMRSATGSVSRCAANSANTADRKSDVEGQSGAGRWDLGGRRIYKKNKHHTSKN